MSSKFKEDSIGMCLTAFPATAFAAALTWVTTVTEARDCREFITGTKRLFGAHTYERIDSERGVFINKLDGRGGDIRIYI